LNAERTRHEMQPQRHRDTEQNASRCRFAAAALAMSDGNAKHSGRNGFAFPSLITSAWSSGKAGRCDALASVRALQILAAL
jgi:hypothetical protein